jgi:transcriptional regulator with XRE-family HTH domain
MTHDVKEAPGAVGERIAEIRKSRDLRQEDLMSVLGVSNKAQISRLESGDRRITVDELKKLADYFHIPLDALVYPDLFAVSYRSENNDVERSEDMQWFRDFRRRYRAFVSHGE